MTIILSALLAAAQVAEESYLEVPIVGRFGETVTARGVDDALRAAESLGADHVVFTVDSRGGDPVAGRDVYQAIGKYDPRFRYHAIVRESTGTALGVLVWCDTISIRPGGKVGGMNVPLDEPMLAGIEPGVILLNVALMAGGEAGRHGHSAELVRAMIDPSEAVVAWTDEDGKPKVGRELPEGVSTDRLILDHPAGKVLTLDDRQAVEVGFAVADSLALSEWADLGPAGREMMEDAAEMERAKKAALRDGRKNYLIDQNRARREATRAAIERFLNLAHEWNPKLGTYSTYKENREIWDRYWEGGSTDTNRLTPEARQRWRDRTDVTAAALSKARGGVLEMRELEKEARRLGLPALYPNGALEEMRLDLELKIAMLVRERDQRFKEER